MNAKRWAVGLCSVLAAGLLAAVANGAAVSVGHSGWRWGNPLPQGNTIRVLDFNGGTGYAAGDFGTLLKTTDAGATWTGIPPGITASLRRVDVISPSSVANRCSQYSPPPGHGRPPLPPPPVHPRQQ